MTPDDPDRYRDPAAWPYSFELLNVDWLFVDDRYQRPLTKIAGKIADEFDRALLEPLLVSYRGRRRYAIADGQNRWEGAKRIGERWLWSRVMRLTPPKEAHIFSKLQSERKNISPLERYKADVFAGDEEAVMVALLLKRNDIHTSGTSGSYSEADALSAITTVRRLWTRYGDEHMDLIFQTIKAAFPDARGRYSSELIGALSRFYTSHDDVNQARLVVALSDEIGSLRELTARSAAKRRGGTGLGGGSFIYTVRVIEEAYRAVGRKPFRAQWERPE